MFTFRSALGDLGANVLEELRHRRKTTDNNSYRYLGPSPESHGYQLPARVSAFDSLPCIVRA